MVSVLTGRHAREFFKGFRKIGYVFKPRYLSNLRIGKLGGYNQVLSFLDTLRLYVIQRPVANNVLEVSGEIIGVLVGPLGQ